MTAEAAHSRWLREQGRRYREMVRRRTPEDQQAVDALTQAADAALFGPQNDLIAE